MLAPHEWAVVESKKRDLVIFSGTDSRPEEQWRASQVVEVKVLYSTYARAKIRENLERFRVQILQCKEGESEDTQRAGIILASWDTWKPVYPSFEDFAATVNAELRAVCEEWNFTFGSKELQAVVGPLSLKVAGRHIQVTLAGCWISAKSVIVDSPFTAADIAEAKRRIASPGPRYTTKQVLEYLQSLDNR